ncbi:putative box C/D snoRNA protein SPCC613.07 isoform X2 [Dioscorea cayenensis subsp. rotundata]|uniref:Box C/D snoRNA protein 1 n=1 Tax=Dioscorea cayennensis subsp. rotundata TaxID=55577 RepID=A0AB40C3U6_DIOCR|nr:putative box C/D snoRNA protein SPCC613.07 isoform X2 [Dioscorea cayenensis subsp. rotundata]
MPELETTPNPNPSAPSLCEECGLNPWKYRCPGCSIRTCALPCVKAHKQRTSCTGKRSRAEPIPISQFNDDLLLSDYKFLEEGKRVADSARRTISGLVGNIGFHLPTRLKILRNAARRRRTQVLFLSQKMAKSERNRSRYDIRKNTIFWTIEWRFNGTDVSLIDHGADEYTNLHSLLEKHLKPSPWNHPLKPYCDIPPEDLKIFIQKTPKGSKSPFRMLSVKAPFGQQMANIVLVEHPIIHVYLPSHNYDFDIDNDLELLSHSKTDDPPGSSDGIPNSKSLYFREEQIEEGELSSFTKVTDLMDHSRSRQSDKFHHKKNAAVNEKTSDQFYALMSKPDTIDLKSASGEGCNASVIKDRNTDSNSGANHTRLSNDVKFEFEQELKDAYSDLVGEINPDDFLCFDGVYSDEYELEEQRANLLILDGRFLGEDQLEEGEIPDRDP